MYDRPLRVNWVVLDRCEYLLRPRRFIRREARRRRDEVLDRAIPAQLLRDLFQPADGRGERLRVSCVCAVCNLNPGLVDTAVSWRDHEARPTAPRICSHSSLGHHGAAEEDCSHLHPPRQRRDEVRCAASDVAHASGTLTGVTASFFEPLQGTGRRGCTHRKRGRQAGLGRPHAQGLWILRQSSHMHTARTFMRLPRRPRPPAA